MYSNYRYILLLILSQNFPINMVVAASSTRHDNCSNTAGHTIYSITDCDLCVVRHLHWTLSMYNRVWTPHVPHQ